MADKPTGKDVKTAEELDEALKSIENSGKKAAAALSQMASATKGTAQSSEYASRATRALIKAQEKQIALIQQQISANQGNKDAIKALEVRLRKHTTTLNKLTKAQQNQNRMTEAANKGIRNLTGALGVNADATENFIFQLIAMASKLQGVGSASQAAAAGFGAMGAAANTAANFIEQGFLVILKKAWDVAVGLNEAQYSFARSIGASTGELANFKSQMEAVTMANLRAGVTAEQTGEAYTALYTSISEFSRMSARAQQSLGNTVTLLMQNGTSAQDAAQSMQMLNKVLGQSGSQLAQTVRGLDSFARALNVPPAIVQQEFAEMSMDLSVYGGKMVDVFKDLRIAAKDTGLSMNQLMAITGQFDTFEGAAEAAGRLNAILGRDLFNSLDMLMTVDPTERFRKLREGIMMAAGSFQELSYYEKRAIADAAGLQGVGELALLMSGHLERSARAADANAMSAEQMAQQQMALMSMQQKWNATLAALAPSLMELMEWLQRMVTHISQNIDRYKELGQKLFYAWGAFKVVGAILPMVTMGLQAQAAAMTLATGAARGLQLALIGGGLLGGLGLVAAVGMLAAAILKPQHSPSLYDAMASFGPRMRRAGTSAREAAAGFDTMGRAALPIGGAMSGAVMALSRLQSVDTSIMDKIANSIRNIASAIKEVDVNKSMDFRASINTFASAKVSQVVQAAVQLTSDDVAQVSRLVEQANKLAVASTVSNGDELSALVRAVAQIAATTHGTGGGGGGGGYQGPQNVEVTLKMAGATLARQVVPLVDQRLREQGHG